MHHKIKCQLRVSWLFAEESQLPPILSTNHEAKLNRQQKAYVTLDFWLQDMLTFDIIKPGSNRKIVRINLS